MVTGLKHELYLDGAWRDITGDVRGDTTVKRGLSGEDDKISPATCSFTVDNRSGDYGKDNPDGAWYGYLNRNTPHRCSVDMEESFLDIPGGTTDTASAPDSASLSITGDIELWADVTLYDWRVTTALVHKWTSSGNQRSYILYVYSTGQIGLGWSPDGTTEIGHLSTAQITKETGRLAVRATLDVNNGASGHTTKFYTAPAGTTSWTQLGDTIVTSGTTSIYDSTSPVYAGDMDSAGRFNGKIHTVTIVEGLGGTTRADPDFTAQTGGASSFSDAAGNTWTINGNAAIIDRDYRFYGEVPDWTMTRDHSGNDVTVPVTSSDIFRRLGAGRNRKSLDSAYKRGCVSTVASVGNLVAYWPTDEPSGADLFASALAGFPPLHIHGSPTLASDSMSFLACGALPVMSDDSAFSGGIRPYAATNEVQIFTLVKVPSGGVSADTRLFGFQMTGSAPIWDLTVTTSGVLSLTCRDATGTTLFTSAAAFGVNGKALRVGVQLAQNGSDVDTTISTLAPGASSGLYYSGTLTSRTVGRCTWYAAGQDHGLSGVTVGSITIQRAITTIFDFADLLSAWTGPSSSDETTGGRVTRLCGEENIPCRVRGASADSSAMGAQLQKTLMELLDQCAETETGILYSSRDRLGIEFRTRRSMTAQSSDYDFSVGDGDLSAYVPIPDDARTLNDLELSREGGSRYRYTDDTSVMGTQDPPDGAGLYDQAYPISLEYDRMLRDQTTWRVGIGTSPDPRVHPFSVHLGRSVYANSLSSRLAVRALDIGSKVGLDDRPAQESPDSLDQLIVGYSERINQFEHEIDFIGIPYQHPWNVGIWESADSRWSPQGCTVNGAHDSSTTSLSVTVTDGVGWTHDDGDYDILVKGERMTVTAVGSLGATQTLTVTRSVNGIVRSHSDGEAIELMTPVYYGL